MQPETTSPRSPGRAWWWTGGILVAIAILLVVGGFIAPFLAFPFDTMGDPQAPPDPDEISSAVGATFAGVGAVFAGFLVGAIGVVLVIVGFVRHSQWRRERTGPAVAQSQAPTAVGNAPPPASGSPPTSPPPPPAPRLD